MADEQQTPELVKPVIDHTEKITRLEERQTQQEAELYRRLSETESQLRQAIEEGGRGASLRIATLEEKIEGLLARIEAAAAAPAPAPAPETPAAPAGGIDFEVPPIEESPAPPEKVQRGIRARRKQRREGKGK